MIYKTSLDKLAKIITVSVTVLFGAILIGQGLFMRGGAIVASIITTLILLSIYVGAFLFRPLSYRLTKDKIVIQRPLANIKIERKAIKSIRQVAPDQLKRTIRTFGVGGLFGYWGQFTNTKLGNMTWYATRRNNAVLIETVHNQKFLLTPDEPQQFVADYNA